jgi:hypothetical protein
MSLNVMKDDLKIVPLHSFIKKDSTRLVIIVQIVPYFDQKLNKICYVWWHKFLEW